MSKSDVLIVVLALIGFGVNVGLNDFKPNGWVASFWAIAGIFLVACRRILFPSEVQKVVQYSSKQEQRGQHLQEIETERSQREEHQSQKERDERQRVQEARVEAECAGEKRINDVANAMWAYARQRMRQSKATHATFEETHLRSTLSIDRETFDVDICLLESKKRAQKVSPTTWQFGNWNTPDEWR
jgi:hypothetical protein